MKNIIVIAFMLVSASLYAQLTPNMLGKSLTEAVTYFDSKSVTYSKDINAADNSTVLRALESAKFNKDSSKVYLYVLKLKFDANQICTNSDYTTVTELTQKGRAMQIPNVESPGEIIEKAGKTGMLANSLLIIGSGITIIGVNSGSTILTATGGLIALSGLGANIVAWNKIRKAGKQSK